MRNPEPYSYRESDPDPHPVNLNPEPPPCLKEVVGEGFEDLEPDLGVLLVESLDLGAQLVILLQQRAQRLSLHSIVGIGKYKRALVRLLTYLNQSQPKISRKKSLHNT